ncbi:hypothetical protein, partial [Pseudomonas savastanoi]|uniref:hypothetical protein n=1 Tax=Pseudomonas savastanoi TaxID=29438 RepID=UPI001C116D4C
MLKLNIINEHESISGVAELSEVGLTRFRTDPSARKAVQCLLWALSFKRLPNGLPDDCYPCSCGSIQRRPTAVSGQS